MDAAPIAELAWASARAGHASLRFQYRGVGASAGEPDGARAVEDAEAALQHLAQTAGPRLALASLGAGAAVALALARNHPEIDRVVLVAPDRLPEPPLPAARLLVLLPERGGATSLREAEAAVGAAGRVALVPEADPLFRAGLPQLGKAALDWVTGNAR